MKTVGIYALDHDRAATSSLGIINHTKQLIAAMAEEPDPGFEIRLLLSETNRDDIGPAEPPPWMTVEVLAGNFGSGAARIWADHVVSRKLARHTDLIHYPKGWVPIPRPRNVTVLATIHDTIPEFLDTFYPEYASPLKRRYFAITKKHTLRQANRVVTISQFSKDELTRLVPEVENRISVVQLGPGMVTKHQPATARTDDLLVIGSHLPHKATAKTLRLLGAFARSKRERIRVTVVGIPAWKASWGAEPVDIDVHYLGRVPNELLQHHMETSRALVFLSEFEGFGLPPLEAYELGTPVCYRNSTAVKELMDGAPGGWDGSNDESFFKALDETLALTETHVDNIREGLRKRYSWKNAAKDMLSMYESELRSSG